MLEKYDLIVVGGSAQGLSSAMAGKNIGIKNIRVLNESSEVAFPEIVGREMLDVGFGEAVISVELAAEGLAFSTNLNSYKTKALIIALNSKEAKVEVPEGIETSDRVHAGPESLTDPVNGLDILVVGDNDRAVVLSSQFIRAGARSVVLAARGMNPDLLSDASHFEIAKLEKDRLLTVLYRASPKSIYEDEEGIPVVSFGGNRIPDLQFDHVVFTATQSLVAPEQLGIQEDALKSGRIIYVRDPRLDPELPSGTCGEAIAQLSELYSDVDSDAVEKLRTRKRDYKGVPEDLSDEFYNATITFFEPTHSDLWVLRVKPDRGDIDHSPGQYATLALGYWENRIDDVIEPDIDDKWDKLVRRSYSISNRIFNEKGYLASETENGELEFYIVLVPPSSGNIPGLTPRLALKRPGDRIFMGPKVTGRYTLSAVSDPKSNVVFLSTGTGEAPQNSMIVELLRNGHQGKILSAVSVRQWKDLGYLGQHRRLEEMYSNYTYLPMPTREGDVPKKYIQDVLDSGELEEKLGADLDPSNTHIYMCGNPSMIGAPEEVDGADVFPEILGTVSLLVDRGFTIDKRKNPGNIHFEKYW